MADLDTPIAGTATEPFGRVAAMHVMLDGASKAKEGAPMEAVPYDGQSDDAVERAKAQAWLRGWARAKQALAQSGRPPAG